MNYEAIENFSGIVSMVKGEVREIPDEALAKSLIKSGYIKKYVPDDAKEIKEELDKANKTIEDLTTKNLELESEIETLKAQLAEKTPTPEEETPEGNQEEGEGNNAEGNDDLKDGEETSTDKKDTKNKK